MAFQNYIAEGIAVEVVLRFPKEHGAIDMTDKQIIEAEKRVLSFPRDQSRGAFNTWVVSLADRRYRLEDPWLMHWVDVDTVAFRDVFLADRLDDGSLRYERIVEKANWRIFDWLLGPPVVRSGQLQAVFNKVDNLGGFAEEDPWIGGLLWVFLPSGKDYDPTTDIMGALKRIPESELEKGREDFAAEPLSGLRSQERAP